MQYNVFTNDGYIVSIQHNAENGNTTEKEYLRVKETVRNKPIAPDGYGYRLTVGLEWELYELPASADDSAGTEIIE